MNLHRLDEEMLENKNLLRDRTQDGNCFTGRGQCDASATTFGMKLCS